MPITSNTPVVTQNIKKRFHPQTNFSFCSNLYCFNILHILTTEKPVRSAKGKNSSYPALQFWPFLFLTEVALVLSCYSLTWQLACSTNVIARTRYIVRVPVSQMGAQSRYGEPYLVRVPIDQSLQIVLLCLGPETQKQISLWFRIYLTT